VSNGTQNVYYDTAAKAYIDGTPGVPDATLRAYATTIGDLGSKYATFAYRVGNESIPITMGADANYLQALGAADVR
jgi:hypothetical protein